MIKTKIIELLRKTGRVLVSEVAGQSVRDIQREVLAAQHISQFTKEYFPWTTGSLRPSCLITIINDMFINNRRNIVECGAGVSTLVMARAAQKTGARVLSVEDDASWAKFVADALHSEGLGQVASVIHAPLCHTDLSLDGQSWYSAEVLTTAMTDVVGKIDLLVVDGPSVGAVRYPAAPFFRKLLAPEFSVIVDDIPRGTKLFIERWEHQLGVKFRVLHNEFAIASTQPSFKTFLMP